MSNLSDPSHCPARRAHARDRHRAGDLSRRSTPRAARVAVADALAAAACRHRAGGRCRPASGCLNCRRSRDRRAALVAPCAKGPVIPAGGTLAMDSLRGSPRDGIKPINRIMRIIGCLRTLRRNVMSRASGIIGILPLLLVALTLGAWGQETVPLPGRVLTPRGRHAHGARQQPAVAACRSPGRAGTGAGDPSRAVSESALRRRQPAPARRFAKFVQHRHHPAGGVGGQIAVGRGDRTAGTDPGAVSPRAATLRAVDRSAATILCTARDSRSL